MKRLLYNNKIKKIADILIVIMLVVILIIGCMTNPIIKAINSNNTSNLEISNSELTPTASYPEKLQKIMNKNSLKAINFKNSAENYKLEIANKEFLTGKSLSDYDSDFREAVSAAGYALIDSDTDV